MQLLREVEGRAPDRTELQLGEGSAARGVADRAWAQTRSASQAATGTAFAGHATADRWQLHRWFQDERWYDLLVILDDATSEIYYAQLVDEESSTTVLAGLQEVIARKGIFCALYSDRGSHFWLTPQGGEAVDPNRVTQVGRALRELGIQMIPAYSPQARGRSERNFSTWQGRLPQELRLAGCTTLEAANRFLREHSIAEFNRRFQVKPEQAGSAFVHCRKSDLDDIFCLQWQRAVNRDNTVSFENLHLQIEPVGWRSFLGRLHGDGASTSGWDTESALWTALSGSLR